MIIGGAEVFRAALPSTERIYLTRVHGNPAGDVLLDAFDPQIWRETAREPMLQTATDQFPADFVVLDRQR
jgi:dihydrofolate reductase